MHDFAYIAIAIVLAAAALWLLRRAPWRGPKPRYPVVLVHGFMGFDSISIGKDSRHYFNGVVEALRGLGIEVHVPALPMAGSVAQRAERLAKSVREISAGQVHLIGHSMGGLDARYAIRHLGLSQKVRSLTTIGTPHRGSPVANLGAAVAPLLGRIGVAAIGDLTTEAAEHFNRDNPDVPGVRYYSVVSAIEDPSIANSMLRPAYQVLKRVSGPNDGVVPASSQVWGEELERVPWDHWAQIGWSKAVDPVPLYLRLTTVLRRRGG
ncbi:MAG: alpha/beta fold hydrolase [Myxococcota bacterium]